METLGYTGGEPTTSSSAWISACAVTPTNAKRQRELASRIILVEREQNGGS